MTVSLPVLDAPPCSHDPSAFSDRTTRYLKSIHAVPSEPATSGLFVLKEGANNRKLGGVIEKGPWRGARIYALTLVERATCWAGCQNLARCYGDGMPFAIRYEPGSALERAITDDVHRLTAKYPQGIAVRLHVLGDFYSVAYVDHWRYLLHEYPSLRLWGYTHWQRGSAIGDAVVRLVATDPRRASFLRSDPIDPHDPLPAAITVGAFDAAAPNTVSCPEQTGRAASCAACGLCMLGRISVSFHDHSRAARDARRRYVTATTAHAEV